MARLSRFARADQMHFITVGALLHSMILQKAVKVPSLAGGKYSRAAAKRASAVEGSKDGRANETRTIGNALHSIQQRLVDLKGYYF